MTSLGRKNGTKNGELRAVVLDAIRIEPCGNSITDLAIAAQVGCTEAAISQARRALGVKPARVRMRSEYSVGPGLARCEGCVRWYEVPRKYGSVLCPMGHGRLILSSYRLIPKQRD